MNRKRFVEIFTAFSGIIAADTFHRLPDFRSHVSKSTNTQELNADVVICGGGLGGCAAALASLRNNLTVILTEETDWPGGQLTQQGVPPDEHQWIETHGATQLYRDFRNSIRQYYKSNYPLTDAALANKFLNPGDGSVSKLCNEPRVALAVLMEMLAPFISSGKLILLTEYKIISADFSGDIVHAVKAYNQLEDKSVILVAPISSMQQNLEIFFRCPGLNSLQGPNQRKKQENYMLLKRVILKTIKLLIIVLQ